MSWSNIPFASPHVYVSDACGSGFAVARATLDPEVVGEILAVDERWRFKEPQHGPAREIGDAAC